MWNEAIQRRSFLERAAATVAAVFAIRPHRPQPRGPMRVFCLIRYEIDPAQRDAFAEYADKWATVIPRCGGQLVGYYLPYEGTTYVGWALIGFDSLAAYEAYKAKIKGDPEAQANFALARSRRVILKEERSFVEGVPSTLQR